MDRRGFVRCGVVVGGALAFGCRGADVQPAPRANALRLGARPATVRTPLAPGTHELQPGLDVAGQLFIPPGDIDAPRPLLVMLHGAGLSRNFMHRVFPSAERHGVIAVTPQSTGRTWDLIVGSPGPDVAALDRVLRHLFERCSIDAQRIVLAGFSDGGSYALSVGLCNGDLFSHVVAFAPGFMRADARVGMPRVFISHGTADNILPLERTGEPIRRQLMEWGYDVTFRTFDGGHGIDLDHLDESLQVATRVSARA